MRNSRVRSDNSASGAQGRRQRTSRRHREQRWTAPPHADLRSAAAAARRALPRVDAEQHVAAAGQVDHVAAAAHGLSDVLGRLDAAQLQQADARGLGGWEGLEGSRGWRGPRARGRRGRGLSGRGPQCSQVRARRRPPRGRIPSPILDPSNHPPTHAPTFVASLMSLADSLSPSARMTAALRSCSALSTTNRARSASCSATWGGGARRGWQGAA